MPELKKMPQERVGQRYALKYQSHHGHEHPKHYVQSTAQQPFVPNLVTGRVVYKSSSAHLVHYWDGVAVHALP